MVYLYTAAFTAALLFPSIIQGAMIPLSGTAPKAIYYMTNDALNAAPNSIIAIPVAGDGTLDGPVSTTLTGGLSGARINPNTGALESPDALASAGSVQVVGQLLLAVNPGSNTISVFRIDEYNATKLTLLGQPQDTKGEFPISIAVSTKNQLVCVANGGAINGISCASYSSDGLGPFDQLRNFNLDLTTPPVGLGSTVSHVFFSDAEDVLFTTVKGTTATNPNGFLSASRVINGKVAYNDTRSSISNTTILFGAATIPGTTDILVAEFTFGGEVISVNAQLQGSAKAHVVVPNTAGSCWATFSTASGTGFTADGGNNQLAEIDVEAGTLATLLRPANSNFGMNDVTSVGNWVYALSPNRNGNATAVTVFDVSGGKGTGRDIQSFLPGGAHNYASGLAWSQ